MRIFAIIIDVPTIHDILLHDGPTRVNQHRGP